MKTLKFLNNRIVLVMCLLTITLSQSCGGDDGPTEPSAQELAYEDLAGNWQLESISLDNQDVILNYAGLILMFSTGSYTTQNAGDLFRASGTWQWADETTASRLNMDDGKEITIQSLSATRIQFSFSQSGNGGVAAGTGGSYRLTLTK